MKETVHIRKAQCKDADALAELYLQFWESHKHLDPLLVFEKPLTKKNQREAAKRDIRKRSVHLFVAEVQGEIVGFIEVLIKKNDPCFRIKEYGYINAATTHKGWRKRGIMKALFQEALHFLRTKNIHYVKTNVYLANEIAQKTWQALGFLPQSLLLIQRI